MAIPKKVILDLINDLPEEKIGKVISFIRFIQSEDDEAELVLEPDDEEDVIRILEEDEWYNYDQVKKMIEGKQNE